VLLSCSMSHLELPTKMFPTGTEIWFVFVRIFQSFCAETKLTSRLVAFILLFFYFLYVSSCLKNTYNIRKEKSRRKPLPSIEKRTFNITTLAPKAITTLRNPSCGLLASWLGKTPLHFFVYWALIIEFNILQFLLETPT
jgi:hypothetical protein